MAFCRLGADGSDVYCFYNVEDYYEVWSCKGEHRFSTAQETIDFLKQLRDEGENVPQYALDALEGEKDA